MSWESLVKYSEGIIVTTACMASLFARLLISEEIDKCNSEIDKFHKQFGKDFFLEIHNHNIDEEIIIRNHFRNYGREKGIKVIAGTDCHYTLKEDKEIHNIYKQLSYNTVGKSDDDAFNGDGYHLLSYNEMLERFDIEEIENTNIIAEMCNVEIKHNEYHLPKFDTNGVDKYEYLKDMAYKGLERIGKSDNKEYIDRLESELEVIHLSKLEDYFLITADYIKWAENNNIMIGFGRGSASGGILSYLTGITKVDPIKHNLSFARMLNRGRLLQYNLDAT